VRESVLRERPPPRPEAQALAMASRVRDHGPMSDEPSGVIGSLPSTRPHRRSDKRGPAADTTSAAEEKTQPIASKANTTSARKPASKPPRKPASKPPRNPAAKTAGKPTAKRPPANVRSRTPGPPRTSPAAGSTPQREEQHGTLETAIQAAAELTELSLRAGARALRGVVSRLPRP
jgi:hypothetical protein